MVHSTAICYWMLPNTAYFCSSSWHGACSCVCVCVWVCIWCTQLKEMERWIRLYVAILKESIWYIRSSIHYHNEKMTCIVYVCVKMCLTVVVNDTKRQRKGEEKHNAANLQLPICASFKLFIWTFIVCICSTVYHKHWLYKFQVW